MAVRYLASHELLKRIWDEYHGTYPRNPLKFNDWMIKHYGRPLLHMAAILGDDEHYFEFESESEMVAWKLVWL